MARLSLSFVSLSPSRLPVGLVAGFTRGQAGSTDSEPIYVPLDYQVSSGILKLLLSRLLISSLSGLIVAFKSGVWGEEKGD